MRIKPYAFLLDLAQRRKREHLESAGVCKDGLVPVHKPVQSAKLFDHFISRPDMEVVCVGKLDLRFDLAQIIC